MKLDLVSRSLSGAMLVLAGLAGTAGFAGTALAADTPRNVRVLVVLRVLERPGHISIGGTQDDSGDHHGFGGTTPLGRTYVDMLIKRRAALNNQFLTTIDGFDRDTAMTEGLKRAFARRSAMFEITTTADREKFLDGASSVKPMAAARDAGYDFVVTLCDDFMGLSVNDEIDAERGLLTPVYQVRYMLHDAATGKVRSRGRTAALGFVKQPFDTAVKDRDFFTGQWPLMCSSIATQLVDQLLRQDDLHHMAESVGRGAEMPPVSDRLADLQKRLKWKLEPASGWNEFRVNPLMRMLRPRGALADSVSMRVDVDFLIPELGQKVASVDEYVALFDRDRRISSPQASGLVSFEEPVAPGYRAFGYAGAAGEPYLVFFRQSGAETMQIVTVSFNGKLEELYPPLRGKIGEMLTHSLVTLD